MYIEAGAHAMARAMQIVDALLPHGIARQHVELGAATSCRKTHHGQSDVALQHQGIVGTLLRSERAQSNGAGDVGGAVGILRSRIKQQQATGRQGCIALGRGFVVDNGTVRSISCNRVEREPPIERLPAAQFLQSSGHAQLSVTACLHSRHQPVQELHHGHAIAQHGLTKALLFGFVLHRLEGGNGAHSLHNAACAGDTIGRLTVAAVGVEQDRNCTELCQVGSQSVIRAGGNALRKQVVTHLCTGLFGMDIQDSLLGCHQHIPHSHRATMHITPTQVGEPCHLVELPHQHGLGIHLAQASTQTSQLVGGTLPRTGQRMDFHREGGDRRAVGPERFGRIGGRHQLQATSSQPLIEPALVGYRIHPPVYAHLAALRQTLAQPFGNPGRTRYAFAHELEGRASQLLCSRQEIAAVGPKRCLMEGDYGCACTPVKAAYPLACFPMMRYILPAMGIGAGKNERTDATTLHITAQLVYALANLMLNGCHNHIY